MAPPDLTDRLLAGYAPPDGVPDELLKPDGSMRAVWEPLIRHLGAQSVEGLSRAFTRGDRYLHDAGVYFRQHTEDGSTERNWPLSHVPVMIAASEWQDLVDGITQRADLLERVMADLYGPADLVREGMLPAELVARNPEWLRPIVGVTPRSGHHLHFLAFEIGRAPDGGWFVLGDRTQAPSGAGFALETRMATSHVFPDLFAGMNVERLAGFFRRFRDALIGLRDSDRDRVAILTPGQHTDTYFEHAYIARYLGFMLLESEELKVDNGRLTVSTIHGPQPISVLWRRLDSRFADPLELDEASALGTPGMVSALRAGAVTMVNCLGSGVLEARAMLAFLPAICEQLTGEKLKLPNIATWWCGQDSERAYVQANIERMLIGPANDTRLPFDSDATVALGGKFRTDARTSVKNWIDQQGPTLVGQEAVRLSTTPAMINGKLVPRPMMVRVFAARTPSGWTVMPGGYARIGRTPDPTALTMQDGGSVADVWVVSDQPVRHETLAKNSDGPFLRRLPALLPSRAADNLFWLGRYVERAECSVRLLRAYHQRLDAYGPDTLPLTENIADYLGANGMAPEQSLPEGLLSLFDASRTCAGKVRDRFSTDGWNALSDLARTARDFAPRLEPGDDAASAMGVLLRKLAGFSGLVHENMFRFNSWRFLWIGRALERADQMAGLLIRFADPEAPAGSLDVAVEVGDSVMTHRRRYSVETSRSTVIDLLALDSDNPRAIAFQLAEIRQAEEQVSLHLRNSRLGEAARIALQIHTQLRVAQPEEITTERLVDMRKDLLALSEALSTAHLS